MSEVSGNIEGIALERFMDLIAMKDEPLHPDLLHYVEEGALGRMIRHPLVYDLAFLPGQANRTYKAKQARLQEALAEQDWSTAVFLHERPYRLRAFIDYCIGTDYHGDIIPLVNVPEHWDLACDIWTDSENIEQMNEEWRQLICQPGEYPTGLFLGNRDAFESLDWHSDGTIIAMRGGAAGDWSWTLDPKVAEFFSRRSGFPPRRARIHRDDCFGYITDRSESELLVRLTPERYPLVYPNEGRA